MILPEVVLQNICSKLLKIVKQDYAENEEKETILFRMFHQTYGQEDELTGQKFLENLDKGLYKQAKALFLEDDESHPNFIKVRLFFERNRATLPTLHITLPSEVVGPYNSIGTGEGDYPTQYNKDSSLYFPFYSRNFTANYFIVCTSQSPLQTIMLYGVVQHLFISAIPALETLGFTNVKLGGNDLRPYEELQANPLYIRGLSIAFDVDKKAPALIAGRIIKDIKLGTVTILS